MTAEQVEAMVAVASLLAGLVAWLWRTAAGVSKAHVELGIFKSDMAGLKADTRELRDNHIRADSAISNMASALAKLDKIDTLITSVATLTAIVERLERRVDRRPEEEHQH